MKTWIDQFGLFLSGSGVTIAWMEKTEPILRWFGTAIAIVAGVLTVIHRILIFRNNYKRKHVRQ